MAIRYTPELNKEIRKTVKNFNQKRNRAIKRGYTKLPNLLKVSQIKKTYTTRDDLKRALSIITKFNKWKDESLKEVENESGAKINKWSLEYYKAHEKSALEYYKKERELVADKVGRFPAERIRLENINAQIEALSYDTDTMDQEQLNSYQASIRKFLTIPEKMEGGYRGFMGEVEQAMTMLGYSKSDINKTYSKLKQLTPSQFHQYYEENDLIGRIYELIDSPKTGKAKLTTTRQDAKSKIEALLSELDEDIEYYKNK